MGRPAVGRMFLVPWGTRVLPRCAPQRGCGLPPPREPSTPGSSLPGTPQAPLPSAPGGLRLLPAAPWRVPVLVLFRGGPGFIYLNRDLPWATSRLTCGSSADTPGWGLGGPRVRAPTCAAGTRQASHTAPCAPWHRCGGHCGPGRITGSGVPVSAICAGVQASHVLKASGGAERRGEPHVRCLSCLEHRILPADAWEPGLCPGPEAGRALGPGELEQGPAAPPPGLQLVGVGNKSRAVPPHPSVCRSSVQQPFDSGFPDKPRAKPRGEAGWGVGESVEQLGAQDL